MAVPRAVAHFSPYLTGRQFTIVADGSALTWLLLSLDFDYKQYRWAQRLVEYDTTMRWRAGSFHQLPGSWSLLLRPGPAADPTDDIFPNDATSGEPDACVGPKGDGVEWIPI